MYVPKHFEESRVDVLHEFIRQHPLGMLVASTPDGLEACHVPFLLDPQPSPHGTLRCHVARANPIWQHLQSGAPVLIAFQGANSYISPAWYASKQVHGKVVPTWNYVVVQAHGTATVTHDREPLLRLVEQLTREHESARTAPWQVSDAPADYLDKMLGAIVGLEIPITRLTGNWKLSQNRSAEDRDGVIRGLETEQRVAAPVADLMKR